MKPIHFPQANLKLVGPKGESDPNILPLPVFNDGRVSVSCWEFSEEEVNEIIKNKCIFFSVHAGRTAPPIMPMAFSPFKKSLEFAHSFFYYNEIMSKGIWVYNMVDEDVPLALKFDGATYSLTAQKPEPNLFKELEIGDYFISTVTLSDEESPVEPVLCLLISRDNNVKWEAIPREFYANPEQKSKTELVADVKNVLKNAGINVEEASENIRKAMKKVPDSGNINPKKSEE